MADQMPNSLEPESPLKRPLSEQQLEAPAQTILPEDSTVTKAERHEKNGTMEGSMEAVEPAPKRMRLEETEIKSRDDVRAKVHGIALVKSE
jgi:tRNA-dihydrouridine synthase 3